MYQFLRLLPVLTGVAGLVPVSAAEYHIEMQNSGPDMQGWAVVPLSTEDTMQPDPEAPNGIFINYPDPSGTDSLTWELRKDGYFGRTCLSCPDNQISWLGWALATTPLMPEGVRADSQQVMVDGVTRTYITATWTEGGQATFAMAFLTGIGLVYFRDSHNVPSHHSHYVSSIRLLAYNGINLDTLWGKELAFPTAITPPARRQVAPQRTPRRFDLHEMGIFLGRKSALKGPLPQTR